MGRNGIRLELNAYKHSCFCLCPLNFEGLHIYPNSLSSELLEILAEILMYSLSQWLTNNWELALVEDLAMMWKQCLVLDRDLEIWILITGSSFVSYT